MIYRKTDDPLNHDGSMCLYAPDVTVGPDGRYYLFYVLDKVPVVSVAVCDTPEGKYTYLYTGFCAPGDRSRHGAMVTVLGPDMLSIVEKPVFVAPSQP